MILISESFSYLIQEPRSKVFVISSSPVLNSDLIVSWESSVYYNYVHFAFVFIFVDL